MKKLFAILMATVLVAISLLTCVSAEEPVVYDLMADFKAREINPAWSIYNTGKTDGKDAYTLKYWVNGGSDPGSSEPVDGLSAFGAALGSFPVCIVTAGDNADKLTWCSAGDMGYMYITFTAPADGEYALDFATNRMWAALAKFTPSRYFVKVNDAEPAEGFDVTTSAADTVSFKATYTLKAGDTINIGYDSVENNGAADNSYITSCKVTYTAAAGGDTTPDASEKETYKMADYFGKAESAPFSFGKIVHATGEITPLEATVGTGKINQYDAKEWTAYKTAATHGLTRTDSDAVTDTRFLKGMFWEELGGADSTATIFTAPVAGTYSFKMTANRWWAINTNVAGANGCAITVVAGDDEAKTAQLDDTAAKTVEGTVELKAGETIVFYVDSLGNSASDNYSLTELTVTLDEKAEVETPDNPEPAPDTADVAISIASAVAVAGIIGFAVLTKKR